MEALKLEQLRYIKLITSLNEEEQGRIREIKATAAAKGTYQSGGTIRALIGLRSEKVRRIINGRLEIRRSLVSDFPELGLADSLSELLADMNQLIVSAFHGFIEAMSGLASLSPDAVEAEYQEEKMKLGSYARHEVEILRTEIGLDLHKKENEAAAVSISTAGGHAIVNLGTTFGSVQQSIGAVSNAGDAELARVLQELAAAINAAQELGECRAEYLEQVKFIALHAVEPVNKRQGSVVKGVLTGLRGGLQNAANIAQILAVAGPALAQHFGFKWPV